MIATRLRRVALLDDLREKPFETLDRLASAHRARSLGPPASVRLLTWMFVTSRRRALFRRIARRALGAG